MKKFKTIACILVIAMAAMFVLTACVPPVVDGPVDFKITPLADLTNYGHASTPQYYRPTPFIYSNEVYNGTACASQVTKLEGRIATEKTTFDEYKGRESDQSTYQKIFAYADADGVLTAFAFAAMPFAQMSGLVDYLTDEGDENFFNQYQKLQDYDDILAENPDDGDPEGIHQTTYKNQQRLRRKMLNRLDKMGISGDQAARAIIQATAYAETVVMDAMIPDNLEGVTVDTYFKTLEKDGGLFDYETLVFFKTNDKIRGDVSAATRQSVNDAKLVRGYGYSYDYQIAANKALNEADFEKELEYHFKTSLSDSDALEFARIKRVNYTAGYRYTDTFYSNSFYPALNELEKVQENMESEVYGINELASGTGSVVVVGDGVSTESQISILLGNSTAPLGSAAERQLAGVKVAMKDDLLASDMEHYYYNDEEANKEHTLAMARKQRAYDVKSNKKPAEKAPEQLELQLENIRMSKFIMEQFLARDNKAGLSKCLVGQIYAVTADDIKTVNSMKKELVVAIAELAKYDSGSTDYKNAVVAIGRKNAQLKQFIVVATELVSKLSQQVGAANTQADWDNINIELKAALDYDYKSLPVTNGTDTPQLNRLQYQLVKRYWNDDNKTPYIPGETVPTKTLNDTDVTFDTEHRISRLLENHKAVVYHSAGIILVKFQKVSAVDATTQAITYADWKTVDVSSGKMFTTSGNAIYPATEAALPIIRGPLPETSKFDGWYLDTTGFYKINYKEAVKYDDTTYYAVFKVK